MSHAASDLLEYIDASPTPYHAVSETARRLESRGYTRLTERERWQLHAGDRRYLVRGDGSLIAFEVGSEPIEEAGFRVIGAHTDSPNLRLKPLPEVVAHGYRQLAVEPYGGVLLHTWLDRDLSLAGRVSVAGPNGPQSVLVDFDRALLRVPSLAIHLHSELREKGLKLNAQTHTMPLLGLEGGPTFLETLAAEIGAGTDAGAVDAEDILAFDLMTYDTQPATLSGTAEEFIQAPRIDNLASCHAALTALLEATDARSAATRVIVLYDHEEVGSRTAQGAAGPLLADTLERLVAATATETADTALSQSFARATAASSLISADMAHAVHPNWADRHEQGHKPVLGSGPVIKVNSNQSYATDAPTAAMFRALCRECNVDAQHFVTRSDLGCGSTIGPVSASRVGIATVDVGNPMLSMHSCREMAATADVQPMIDVLTAYFRGS